MHKTLSRPYSLQERQEYLRFARFQRDSDAPLTTVKFLAYDPCPAFVIVQEGDVQIRCPREELYVKDSDIAQ